MSLKTYIISWFMLRRRGVMGTVIFHLLLMILFLSMEISKMAVHAEMEIVMEPREEKVQKREQELRKKEEIRKRGSEEEVQWMLRSIAVNEQVKSASKEQQNVQQYVNEIMQELQEEGKGRYKARKDKNYQSDSLQHARDRREQQLDSLKSTFYSGKSSVTYNLEGRYARILPIPVFKCEFGGKVVVRIVVNNKGVVQKAVVDASQSESDDCLWAVAVDAAERSRFNEKPSAPAQQKGTITYHFVKQ
jgi:outer membrane biosynthesis protein TonB